MHSPSVPAAVFTMAAVSQIGDGQVQGGMHTMAVTVTMTMAPVSQINDGQIQNPVATVPATATPLFTSAVKTANVASIGKPPTVLEQACGISTRPVPSQTDAQTSSTRAPVFFLPASIKTLTSTSTNTYSKTSTSYAPPASSSPQTANTNTNSPSDSPLALVSCITTSTLRLTLSNGTLLDARNRTGYIASNYQFQFDGPPQSGALFTAGWSVCDASLDGSGSGSGTSSGTSSTLALGGNTTFWQCLSGGFYNLYTEDWATQCSPVCGSSSVDIAYCLL